MFVMVQDGSGKGRVSVSIIVTRITGVGDYALKSPTNACCNASLCPSRPIRIVGLTERHELLRVYRENVWLLELEGQARGTGHHVTKIASEPALVFMCNLARNFEGIV